MRNFFKRYPTVSTHISAERVDRGHINMASEHTISSYFKLLLGTLVKYNNIQLDTDENLIQESLQGHKIYVADETGWGIMSSKKPVVARKGAKHVFTWKANDETHKTLMLGVCGNGDVLKPLIILQQSFPLLGFGESEHLPENILLSKTNKCSMEMHFLAEWLDAAVVHHKVEVNPDSVSLLIVDNHTSRFSTEAIDLCKDNKIEMLCYPGHLTHILQGPDVVLNKPISTIVDDMVYNNPLISGNSRVAFMTIIKHAVEKVCTKENVMKAFSATGVIPYDPSKIDLAAFPSSSATVKEVQSPLKVTCSECRSKNVEFHPLVIPKKLAEAFVYTPPPEKPKTKSKVVQHARIITSEEVQAEVKLVEEKKAAKEENSG